MKTKEELNAIKEEVEKLNKKLADLNDEEMAYVSGGSHEGETNWFSIPGPVDPLIQKQGDANPEN